MISALTGAIAMWSRGFATTESDALPVLPPSSPVTVWAPGAVGVQRLPLQEPSGAIEKAVEAVTSPSGLPYTSNPEAL